MPRRDRSRCSAAASRICTPAVEMWLAHTHGRLLVQPRAEGRRPRVSRSKRRVEAGRLLRSPRCGVRRTRERGGSRSAARAADMRDDYDGRDVPTLESLLAVSSGTSPAELPLPEPPVPVELAEYEPVMQRTAARTPSAVRESPQPMEGRNLVADMFAALFAAEQGEAVAPAAPYQASLARVGSRNCDRRSRGRSDSSRRRAPGAGRGERACRADCVRGGRAPDS